MNLTLYKTSSSDNQIGKTKTDPISYTIQPRADFDFSEPTIRIEDTGHDLQDWNYAELDGVFFFIVDVKAANSSVWELDFRKDVLDTYQTEILASVGRFKRQIKPGDYESVDLVTESKTSTTIYNSTKGMDGNKSLILTTIGEGG